MTWYYKDKEFTINDIPEKATGFVYCITNVSSGKMYIGKKQFTFSKKTSKVVKLKNGTKKRKSIRVVNTSDWEMYYGSSDYLKKDIELLGTNNFKREIIRICFSKAECSYFESWEIFTRHALIKDEYYNSWVSTRINRSHVYGKFIT